MADATTSTTLRFATLHPGWVLVGALFVTPPLGASFAAYNHVRHQVWGRAFAAIVLAAAAVVLGGAAPLVLSAKVGFGVALGLHFAVSGVLFWEQVQFRRSNPRGAPVPWIWPVAVGVAAWAALRALPAVVWVITGDPAVRPY